MADLAAPPDEHLITASLGGAFQGPLRVVSGPTPASEELTFGPAARGGKRLLPQKPVPFTLGRTLD